MKALTRFLLLSLFLNAFPALADTVVPESQEEISFSFSSLVKQAAPAVVNIYTKTIVREDTSSRLLMDPFFKQFFGKDFGFPFGPPIERAQNSLGSGVIVSSDGTIVTNNHVIKGADKIRVVLTDRREFDANLIGVDERTDLAVLKIAISSLSEFPYLEFGNSDTLEVGDLVLAIGNPFGVGQTVTSGIVSALARTHVGVADIGAFIQTDAAINPGNSGGALLAMDGRLVGINTAIFSNTGGSLGIGFAVPANMVRFVIEGMGSDGRVIRPWVGLWGQPVSSSIAESLGMNRPNGILVNEIWPNGASDRAGLNRGDVILEVNGFPIASHKEFEFKIASLPIGQVAKLLVFRKGSTKQFFLPLEVAPSYPNPNTLFVSGHNPLMGMTIANMSPALSEKLNLNHITPGVTILKIQRATPAARLRFRPLDQLISINGLDIQSVADVERKISLNYDRWEIVINRAGKRLSIVVSP